MSTFSEFDKKKSYLVCVDSDGCAMDIMDVKHFRCFGPCMVDEWGLSEWKDEILNRWNEINLYTITRGINRFKGLAIALSEINSKYKSIDGVDHLVEWAENAPELSNGALNTLIEGNPNIIIYAKALSWSIKVNEAINSLPDEAKLPFPMVKEALEFAHGQADVAIVSSANLGAVMEEWEQHGLLDHVDVVMSQNDGSKAYCIRELLKKGYEKENVIMCGDAPGDLAAAEKNGVFFYPILVRKEKESWEEFISEGLGRLIDGSYTEYGEAKKLEFYNNLNK
jgi:phosphoglycolate phosphatase-like HAD superfamily hydrolase